MDSGSLGASPRNHIEFAGSSLTKRYTRNLLAATALAGAAALTVLSGLTLGPAPALAPDGDGGGGSGGSVSGGSGA